MPLLHDNNPASVHPHTIQNRMTNDQSLQRQTAFVPALVEEYNSNIVSKKNSWSEIIMKKMTTTTNRPLSYFLKSVFV